MQRNASKHEIKIFCLTWICCRYEHPLQLCEVFNLKEESHGSIIEVMITGT